ncbi:hypothetical protein CLAIMM_12670 [Cladophialophora immunda]|nr:hypothetical protein CLAIMM_12670 [Cladophialophora immunda]
MGCGSSSLKGADIPDINSQPTTAAQPQQIRKIRTNFSDIDYDQDARQRRLTEYAPHEQPPPVREESHDFTAEQSSGAYEQYQQYDTQPGRPDYNAGAPTGYANDGAMSRSGPGDRDNDATLKPYQTIDGGDWDNQDGPPQRQTPYVNGTQDGMDPTSDSSKDEFAAANDPANPKNQDGHHFPQGGHHNQQADGYNNDDNDDANNNNNNMSPISYNANSDVAANPDIHGGDDNAAEPKKSWLGQKYASLQSARRGSGLSDEDLIKYTGKDRRELGEWAQNRPGVGPNQDAGRVGSDSGLAAGAAWN